MPPPHGKWWGWALRWEFEAESLDQFFKLERGFFVNPDAATQQLIAAMNGGAVEGRREIYEVIV